MASLTAEFYNGTAWVAVAADNARIMRTRGHGGSASFEIPVASVSNRLNLRMHRRCRISIVQGSDTIRFIGVITKSRPRSETPQKFTLAVDISELAEEAKTRYPSTPLAYPTRIKPITEVDAPITGDTYVSEGLPTTNFGTDTVMLVRQTGASLGAIGLIQADLSGIPIGNRISSAYLTMFTDEGDPARLDVAVGRVTASWAEGTVTWNTRPTFDADSERGKVLDLDVGHITQWRVTDIIRRLRGVESDATNYGLQLRGVGGPLTSFRRFSTREAAAAKRPALTIAHHEPVFITDVVKDLWAQVWPEINTTAVQDINTELFPTSDLLDEDGDLIETIIPTDISLFDATELLKDMLPNVEWWLEWTGAAIRLRFEQVGSVGPAMTEADINYAWEMSPTNDPIRNVITLKGELPGGKDDDDVEQDSIPIVATVRDSASVSIFGELRAVDTDSRARSVDELSSLAAGRISRQAWEFWRLTVGWKNYAIGPGDQIGVSLPTAGVDGTDFGSNYIVDQVEDVYERGQIARTVTLVETRL